MGMSGGAAPTTVSVPTYAAGAGQPSPMYNAAGGARPESVNIPDQSFFEQLQRPSGGGGGSTGATNSTKPRPVIPTPISYYTQAPIDGGQGAQAAFGPQTILESLFANAFRSLFAPAPQPTQGAANGR